MCIWLSLVQTGRTRHTVTLQRRVENASTIDTTHLILNMTRTQTLKSEHVARSEGLICRVYDEIM